MRTKLFMLFVILIMALTNCNKEKEPSSYVQEEIFDTISVSNPLANNNHDFLMEYIWDKRSKIDPYVTILLVPKGSKINHEVVTTVDSKGLGGEIFYKITKNDFLVVKSDIFYFHPEAEFNNLHYLSYTEKLVEKEKYTISTFPMLMEAKDADKFIEFAPLNVWETKSGMPYFISSLEEWKQGRDWGTIEDSDIVYFKKNGAMARSGRREKLTINEFFKFHDPESEAPMVYIKKDGELIALIGQEGKLWKKR